LRNESYSSGSQICARNFGADVPLNHRLLRLWNFLTKCHVGPALKLLHDFHHTFARPRLQQHMHLVHTYHQFFQFPSVGFRRLVKQFRQSSSYLSLVIPICDIFARIPSGISVCALYALRSDTTQSMPNFPSPQQDFGSKGCHSSPRIKNHGVSVMVFQTLYP